MPCATCEAAHGATKPLGLKVDFYFIILYLLYNIPFRHKPEYWESARARQNSGSHLCLNRPDPGFCPGSLTQQATGVIPSTLPSCPWSERARSKILGHSERSEPYIYGTVALRVYGAGSHAKPAPYLVGAGCY